MKINLEYRKNLVVEKKLIKEIDQLVYRIEQYRTMDSMNRYAGAHGLKPVSPADIEVIEVNNDVNNR